MPSGFDCHARTAREAIELLEAGGVTAISLDHDLEDVQNGTGYDVASYIERAAYTGTLATIVVTIHSANPVGRIRMEQAIGNAKKF